MNSATRTVVAAALAVVSLVGVGRLLTADAAHVPSNAWAVTADMAAARAGAASALLYDGRMLVAGGVDATGAVTTSVDRYSPDAEAFLATPPMADARANHSATLLPDGRVLVAGGVGGSGLALASVEIYDPANNSWTPGSPLHVARAGHTATALYDGRIVIAGGSDGANAIASIEIYDPDVGAFALSNAALSAARTGHGAAQLYDGSVLITGGFNGVSVLASTDIYDPFLDTVTSGPSLASARAGHSTTTLLDGKVLVAGGAGTVSELASAELYDPSLGAFTATANAMIAVRQHHQAFLLPHNNQVLIVGGTAGPNGNAVAIAEVYVAWQGAGGTFAQAMTPAAGRAWATGGSLSFHEELTIRTGPHDGLLLLTGGSAKADAGSPFSSSELYGFATIVTDQADYAPGSTVTITGRGWVPGETVALSLVEKPLLDTHPLEPVTADASGNIVSTEFVPDFSDAGIRFYLTATGSASQAQTSFTDADMTPPTVSSIVRVGGTLTNAANVTWKATFSEPVNGVDAGDFALVMSGLGGAPAIGSVTPIGAAPATQWTIVASTGTGNGTLGLNLNDNDSITDIAGNKLGGTGTGVAGGGGVGNGSFTGQVFTIDRTSPSVTINQKVGQADPTNVSPINFTAVFSKPVNLSTLDNGDIVVSGTAGGAVTAITSTGDDKTFTVTVSGMTADGTVTASIQAGVVTDLAGNPNTASTSTDNSVTWEPKRKISISDVSANEGNGGTTAFNFTVSLDAASALQDISVAYTTVAGTATAAADCSVAGADFKTQSGTATIPKNSVSTTVNITVCGDLVFETNETFFVNLSGPTLPATILDNQGLGTITNDDAAPSFTIGDATQTEGNAGTSTLTFTVAKTGATAVSATVDYALANGSTNPATGGASCGSGVDYVTASGSLNFGASDTSKPITVTVCGDTVFENNETFVVNLSNAANATIGDGQGVGTIVNDDAAPTLAINDVTAVETNSGSTTFTFTVTRTGSSEVGSTVDYATANGAVNPAAGGASCGAGVDYVNNSATLTFAATDTAKPVTVTVCGDTVYEVNETFVVNLTNPVGVTITDSQGLGTITNDDAAPTLAVDDVTAVETNAGSTTFTFTVTRTGATELGASVDFATANGSVNPATGGASCGAGVDYVSQTGSVSFAATDTSKLVTVAVCGDTVYEANETFVVNLTNPVGVTITDNQGLGTITNDDAAPTLAIDDVTAVETNAGSTTFTFTVTRTGATELGASVDFATANGSVNPATGGANCGAGVDYVSQSGSVSFSATDSSKTILLAVCGDSVYEANETFVVNLANPVGAAISDNQGLGTITNDDAAPSVAVNDVIVTEGDAGMVNAVFTVTKTGATELGASVDFATANGSAHPATGGASCGAGVDYVSQTGSLSFIATDTSKTITVAVCGDTVREGPAETFVVNLTNQIGASISSNQGLGTITDDDTFFAGLFEPWGPPGTGSYGAIYSAAGRTFNINSTLPVKWAYTSRAGFVDSSTSTPVVNIYGPLFDCGNLAGPGSATPVSYGGPGSTPMTYNPMTRTWQRNVKLSSPPFVGDSCYIIQIADPVTGVTSEAFPFKTKK